MGCKRWTLEASSGEADWDVSGFFSSSAHSQLFQNIDFQASPSLFSIHIHVHTDALSHTQIETPSSWQTSNNIQITVSRKDLLRWGAWTNKEVTTDGSAPLLPRDTNEICHHQFTLSHCDLLPYLLTVGIPRRGHLRAHSFLRHQKVQVDHPCRLQMGPDQRTELNRR